LICYGWAFLFNELRCTFDDIDITTGDIVSEIRLISFACSSFPGLHHCVVTVVLTGHDRIFDYELFFRLIIIVIKQSSSFKIVILICKNMQK